jgi:putative intracellular protease/amidase
MATVLIPLPDRDFDVSEVAVPWHLLTRAGHRVVFATERGNRAPAADRRTLTGPMFGLFGASREARAFYTELEHAPEFTSPVSWETLDVAQHDGLLLPGGHAAGMRQYLDSKKLQEQVARFWPLGRPVGAVCHGVLVLARTIDPDTGKSVLAQSKTTCLPKFAERTAYLATAWRLGRYYRTYDSYVEDEVRAALDDPERQFVRGPRVLDMRRIVRAYDDTAMVVEDGRYISARWPGDAYRFAQRFLALLENAAARAA